ncbi:hypothetical protein BV898_02751 [Hypsibius exemplaris]|uniref:Uncharacterized protein n=1 Tax=Hypsibius exemplaris TaxID=2072580 RepID=A0A1W0X7L7_HYPEX|nr:hypothetical protein BV898_02751 [Hypsibius exemplaris]
MEQAFTSNITLSDEEEGNLLSDRDSRNKCHLSDIEISIVNSQPPDWWTRSHNWPPRNGSMTLSERLRCNYQHLPSFSVTIIDQPQPPPVKKRRQTKVPTTVEKEEEMKRDNLNNITSLLPRLDQASQEAELQSRRNSHANERAYEDFCASRRLDTDSGSGSYTLIPKDDVMRKEHGNLSQSDSCQLLMSPSLD